MPGEAQIDGSSSDERQKGELSIQYATKLLFSSFRFSQGYPDLQDLFFQYIHQLHPEWKIDETFAAELFESSKKVLINFLNPGEQDSSTTLTKKISLHNPDPDTEMPFSVETIENDTQMEIKNMMAYFNGETPDTEEDTDKQLEPNVPSQVLSKIAVYLIERDEQFATGYSERIRKNMETDGTERYSPYKDPHLSYLCYFGLEGHSTGIAEYDHMFRSLREYLLQSPYEEMGGILYERDSKQRISESLRKRTLESGVEGSIKTMKQRLANTLNAYVSTHPNSTLGIQDGKVLLNIHQS